MLISEKRILKIIRRCLLLKEYRSHASSIDSGFAGLYHSLQYSEDKVVDKEEVQEIVPQSGDDIPDNQKNKDKQEANKFRYKFVICEKDNIRYQGKDFSVYNLYKDSKFKNLQYSFIINRDNAGKGEWKKAEVYRQDSSSRDDSWRDISGTAEVLAVLNAFLNTGEVAR